jgi:hypothetical protein
LFDEVSSGICGLGSLKFRISPLDRLYFDRTNGQAIRTRALKLIANALPRASFCTLFNNLVFVSNINTRFTVEQPRKFIRCSNRTPKAIKRFRAREILMTARRIIQRGNQSAKTRADDTKAEEVATRGTNKIDQYHQIRLRL